MNDGHAAQTPREFTQQSDLPPEGGDSMTLDAVRELDAPERQHVQRMRQGRERLAARGVIEPAQATEAMRVVRKVETHALLLGSDRSIAVLAPRIVRAIPPPGIEVQVILRLWSKVSARSHGRRT